MFLAADGEAKKLTARNTTNVIGRDEIALWKKASQPVVDQWVAEVTAKGATVSNCWSPRAR